jgi:hypothetical protein
VDDDGKPESHAERHVECGAGVDSSVAVEVGENNGKFVWVGAVGVWRTGWVHLQEHGWAGKCRLDLCAGPDSVVLSSAGDDHGCENHNDAGGDNGTSLWLVSKRHARKNGRSYVEPSSKHPGAVLLNLESLDVDVRDDEAHEHADANEANEDLNVKTTAECVSSNHQSAN